MSRRIALAVLLPCSFAALACRDDVSLGNPPTYHPPESELPACPQSDELETWAEVAPELGTIRAMKADADGLFVVAAQEGMPGTLLQVKPGSVQVLGSVGVGAESIALSAAAVFVACAQSSQVFRVAKTGHAILIVSDQPGAHAIVVVQGGHQAHWVLAGNDGAVRRYNFEGNDLIEEAHAVPPVSIAHDGLSLYVSGQGSIFRLGDYRSDTTLSGHCDGRLLALTDHDLLCSDANAINQIPRDPGSNAQTRTVLAHGTAFDLVAGSGRAFFRLEPPAGSSSVPRIMSMPLAGYAAPTVMSRLPGTGRLLTLTTCHLHLAVENKLLRWRL